MFSLEEGDFVRIERSPYVNGHFYLRFKSHTMVGEDMTLGFGYDEPFRENDPFLSNAIYAQLRMYATIIAPVENRWVVYHNDHPRNTKPLPNIYHTITNWFPVSESTSKMVNRIIINESVEDVFKLPFCPFPAHGATHSCRTIILDVLMDSFSHQGNLTIRKYLTGNPMENDMIHGCMIFEIKDGDVRKKDGHPCTWVPFVTCCKPVVKKTKVLRCPVDKNNT